MRVPVVTGEAPSDPQRWLALWTKSRAEKAVSRNLEAVGVVGWLPSLPVRRRWSDRWKTVDVPLFPGYVFARSSARTWSALLGLPGVLAVVRQGKLPAWIHEDQIAELKFGVERMLASGSIDERPEVVEFVGIGDRVRVDDGPMAGLVGVVREIRGSRRILIGLEQIGKGVSVSIGAAHVTQCHPDREGTTVTAQRRRQSA